MFSLVLARLLGLSRFGLCSLAVRHVELQVMNELLLGDEPPIAKVTDEPSTLVLGPNVSGEVALFKVKLRTLLVGAGECLSIGAVNFLMLL